MEYESQFRKLTNNTKFSHLLKLRENSEIDTFFLCVLYHYTSQNIEPAFLESFVNKFSFEAGESLQELLISNLDDLMNPLEEQNIIKSFLLPEMRNILIEFLHENSHIFLTNFWEIVETLNEEELTEDIIELVCMAFDITITIVNLEEESEKVYFAKVDESSLIYISSTEKIEGLLYIRQSIENSDLFGNHLDVKTPYMIQKLELNEEKQIDYFKTPFKIIKNILKSISLELKTRIDEQRLQELFEYEHFDFSIFKFLKFGALHKEILKQCRVMECKNQASYLLNRCEHKICENHLINSESCPACGVWIYTPEETDIENKEIIKIDPKLLTFRENENTIEILHNWETNKNLCFLCGEPFTYGTDCTNCSLLYCAKCICRNIWEHEFHINCLFCKQKIDLGDALECEGCNKLTHLSMFVPLNTCSHFYLCKFCWYLQFENRKCRVDKNPLAHEKVHKFECKYSIFCMICEKFSLQYLERNFCPYNHLVCHKCQTQSIEEEEKVKCRVCKKTHVYTKKLNPEEFQHEEFNQEYFYHPSKNSPSPSSSGFTEECNLWTILKDNLKSTLCYICGKKRKKCYTCLNCEKWGKLTIYCSKCFAESVDKKGCFKCSLCSDWIINIHQPSVCCGCKKLRYLRDFVFINTCSHNEVCKECWFYETLSKQCIIDNKSISNEIIEEYIKEYEIQCEICLENKIEFYSDEVCVNECIVCYECQGQNENCARCGLKLSRQIKLKFYPSLNCHVPVIN